MAAVSGVSRLCLSVSFRGIKHKAQLVKQTLPKVSVSPPFRSFTCVATATKEEDTKPAEAHSRWRIAAGVCVLRMPTLSKQKDQLTVDFEELQDQVWLEKSKLSDFELEELELERLKEAKLQKALEDERPESEGIDEADELREMVEARETELKEFKPAPRETEADRSGDMRTHHRKLDRVLYLLVKKPREKHAWQMPQGGIDADESLLECAKRELQEECGDSLDVRFYSPAPHAVYTYSHPPLSQSNPKQSGSKVFFLKAYCCGNCEVKLNKDELVDYAWVTKEEMKHYVSDSYYDVVRKILTE